MNNESKGFFIRIITYIKLPYENHVQPWQINLPKTNPLEK